MVGVRVQGTLVVVEGCRVSVMWRGCRVGKRVPATGPSPGGNLATVAAVIAVIAVLGG